MIELQERRKVREPEIKVWDLVVRIGHWLLVLSFGVLYLRYRQFPLHAYMGYLVTLIVVVRIIWGFVGTKHARFNAFWYGPAAILAYTRQAFSNHAPYFASHNPLGAVMVYVLLCLLLVTGLNGVLLASSGQELGPLGSMVPNAWEDTLLWWHKVLGHITAACVVMHMAGLLWATWLHRENYIYAMFTGRKRVPRQARDGES